MDLSVIVPVFKVEEYIGSFLDSLFRNVPEGVEFVFVDDGSPDKSMDILNSFIEKNSICKSLVKIYSQENKGLSGARNSGVNLAKGKYISFLDPDDEIESSYFDVILSEVKLGQNPDIITFNACSIDTHGNYLDKIDVCDASLQEKNHALLDIFNKGRWYAWSRAYRQDFFKDFAFPEGKRFEDLLTTPFVYLAAEKIVNKNDILVKYRTTPQGISNNPKDEDIKDIRIFANQVFKDFEFETDSKRKSLLYIIYLSAIKTLYFLTVNKYGYVKSYLAMKDFRERISHVDPVFDTMLNKKNKIFSRKMFLYYIIQIIRRK
jgi:glycosyltransferase involved in cell wall biosynthesis